MAKYGKIEELFNIDWDQVPEEAMNKIEAFVNFIIQEDDHLESELMHTVEFALDEEK